jgi:HK97 family phage major capsid protein
MNQPIVTSSYVPAVTSGAKVMAFGDFGYFWVADRQGRTFKRLNELFAQTGQVGFLSSQRVDGKLVLPEAIQVMQVKA